MAIHENGEQQFDMGAAAPAAQAVTAQPAVRQPAQGGQSLFSFRNASNVMSAPLGRHAGGELIQRLSTALEDTYKGLVDKFDIKLHAMDNNNVPGLAMSAGVVWARNKARRDTGVAYHTLILGGTANPIPPRIENINGRQVEVLLPASAAWDQRLAQMVQGVVSAAYPNAKLLPADATVVPRNFNMDNKNDVYNLARNTILALSVEIDTRTPGFTDVSLTNLDKANYQVAVRFDRTQISDDVGMPMRSDIQIEYSEQSPNKGDNRSIHTADSNTVIGAMSGFVDFAWAPVVNTNPYMMQQPQAYGGQYAQALPTQKYVARLVLTQIDPVAIATLPAILNLIATSSAASEMNNWQKVFLSARGSKSSMYDPGALNFEANIRNEAGGKGSMIDTSGDSFTEEDLRQMLAVMVRPGLAIAVDVPDCGPQTWYTSILSAAANGSVPAQNAIIAAANYLTGGHFGRVFPANAPLFIDQGNRVHLGYYTNKHTNQMEDIRNIDYLAVLNMRGATDPGMVRTWSDSFSFTSEDIRARLDVRARVIRELAPTATFTGFATRCTFSGEFLQALYSSILACGVRPSISVNGGSGIHADRGVASFANGGLLLPGQNSFFSYGGASQAGYFNNQYNGFNNRM